MPAENNYSHFFTSGIENRIIFQEKEDYDAFLEFLKAYLCPPEGRDAAKKVFTIRGQSFQGVPHQNKNFYNKVDLIAYSLKPNHFHLVLEEKSRDGIAKLIRSIRTRYSIYFNKKHHRSGHLFAHPKLVQIPNQSDLLYLTRYLHTEHSNNKNSRSSYQEFLGIKTTPWVKPDTALSWFETSKHGSFQGMTSYKQFVEAYELNGTERERLERLILENKSESALPQTLPQATSAPNVVQPIEDVALESEVGFRPRIPEFIAAATVFILLFGLGLRSVNATSRKTTASQGVVSGAKDIKPTLSPPPAGGPSPSPSPAPSSSPTPTPSPKPTAKPTRMLTVKITDGSATVNIRNGATTSAEIIAKAKDGDTFRLVATGRKWYEIKLADGLTGYISTTYAEFKDDLNTNK